jgi:hypothetical protein
LAIIEGATTSQEFAGKGATFFAGDLGGPVLSTAADDLLQVRFDAGTNTYEILLPGSSIWQALSAGDPASGDYFTTGGQNPVIVSQLESPADYRYSSLAAWAYNSDAGSLAFGIPTASGDVPVTGSATYTGPIAGHSDETSFDLLGGGEMPGFVNGSISLGFNFGAGTLSGSIHPVLYTDTEHALPTLDFTHTVYSTGSATFSGEFDTNLSGMNAFSGRFTGPAAEELIGGFAFPYKSPTDGATYNAAGGFVASKP